MTTTPPSFTRRFVTALALAAPFVVAALCLNNSGSSSSSSAYSSLRGSAARNLQFTFITNNNINNINRPSTPQGSVGGNASFTSTGGQTGSTGGGTVVSNGTLTGNAKGGGSVVTTAGPTTTTTTNNNNGVIAAASGAAGGGGTGTTTLTATAPALATPTPPAALGTFATTTAITATTDFGAYFGGGPQIINTGGFATGTGTAATTNAGTGLGIVTLDSVNTGNSFAGGQGLASIGSSIGPLVAGSAGGLASGTALVGSGATGENTIVDTGMFVTSGMGAGNFDNVGSGFIGLPVVTNPFALPFP